MLKLGVKTSKYANTDLYTSNPIDEAGHGTIRLSGLKYGFERGFKFYKVDVPAAWYNPDNERNGEHEKYVGPQCTKENQLTDWEEIEAFFNSCVYDPNVVEPEYDFDPPAPKRPEGLEPENENDPTDHGRFRVVTR